MTLQDIEKALDSGKLFVRMKSEKYWVIRRNGQTRRWKRDPQRFYIPYKYGLYGHGNLTESNLSTFDTYYKIKQ